MNVAEQNSPRVAYDLDHLPSTYDEAAKRIAILEEQVSKIAQQLVDRKVSSFASEEECNNWRSAANNAIKTRDSEIRILEEWIARLDTKTLDQDREIQVSALSLGHLQEHEEACRRAISRAAKQFEELYGEPFSGKNPPHNGESAYVRRIFIDTLENRMHYLIEGIQKLARELGILKSRFAEIKLPLYTLLRKGHKEKKYLTAFIRETLVKNKAKRLEQLKIEVVLNDLLQKIIESSAS